MKISASNIIFHELIGLRTTVVDSVDETLKGLSGDIVDETKQTIKIRTEHGVKTTPKAIVTLKIELPDRQAVVMEGKNIAYRPEDRIRRMKRR